MHRIIGQRIVKVGALLAVVLLLAGCSLLFGGGNSEEATPEAEERTIVPTFTPTPEVPPTDTLPPPTQEAAVAVAPATAEISATEATTAEVNAQTPVTQTLEAPLPTPLPKVVVSAASANARSGPGTEFGLVGAVTQGQSFDIIGKNADGTWWQFCCVNGQQAWVFGELVSAENSESVQVAQDIPAAPVAAAQPTATQAPAAPPPAEAAPTNTPEPAPPPAAGAVNAGGCGGDDGCKFKMTGGPSFADNGGGEMKIRLLFVHSGIDGGQPQGDYRLGIERDGQLITTFADTTSIRLEQNQSSMGPYNYEARVEATGLPGGTLEGNYFFWVLDGNRERDSDVFQMYVPPGQGEIWIKFDQG